MPATAHNGKNVDNLIIGSGPAALATAMALRRLSIPFEILDVGFEPDPTTSTQVNGLAARNAADWDPAVTETLFPPPVATTAGVERRLCFGSDFPYRLPASLSATQIDCATELSHGLGGLGNVWGAAVLPYNDQALKAWPIDPADFRRSYANVARYMPVSGERDSLETSFPFYSDRVSTLDRSPQVERLLEALGNRRDPLSANGINFGRARLAVDSTGGQRSCRYCGQCLNGCVYGSIFNPLPLLKRLEAEGVKIHKGVYALEIKETATDVSVIAVDLESDTVRTWTTRRVYVAAGQFGTTRLIARSLRLYDKPIRILDSQYFFFPLFAYRRKRADIRFTLAEVFLEILSQGISRNCVHMQVYGKNAIFDQLFKKLFRVPSIARQLLDRLYLFQGFLHSDDSGHLELRLVASGEKKDEISIRGISNADSIRTARRVQSMLRRMLAGFGIIPPLALRLAPAGRSSHMGGGFPMGGTHPVYRSDLLGRPAGLQRTHIMDAATFPAIAGSTMLFTIMANADRIVTAQGEQLHGQ